MPATAAKVERRVRDCLYDTDRQEFMVIFRDGKMYRIRRDWLPEDDGTEIRRIQVESDGSAFVVEQTSGRRFEIPWDFVLYHADPKYRFYKRRRSQRDTERDVALRLATRVREVRQQKGLTSYELARRSGIARPNISRIERGKHVASVDTLERLARALGVSPAQLLYPTEIYSDQR
ncbi:MAG TPA: helix-turn-helix transcriptional regulator [Anaerolineales bacterium]